MKEIKNKMGEVKGDMRGAVKQMTKKLVTKLYKTLENTDVEPLTLVLESIVGALRNVETASNVDVELYLKKFEGFMYSMGKVDPHKVKKSHAQTWMMVVEQQKDAFTNIDNPKFKVCQEFFPFYLWLSAFMRLTFFSIEDDKHKKKINDFNGQIDSNNKVIQMDKTLIENLEGGGHGDFLRGDLNYDLARKEKVSARL